MISRTVTYTKRILRTSDTWAQSVGMQWAVDKSYGIEIPEMLELNRKSLPIRYKGEYLGLSLGQSGVKADRLTEHFNASIPTLLKLMRITKAFHAAFCQRRAVFQQFVLSVTDYDLYRELLSEVLCNRASEIELLCVRFVTVVNLKPREVSPVMLLTRLLPLRHHRRRHLIKTMSKFFGRENEEETSTSALENWTFLL